MLASGKDINVLVMDTEVYSNTGGQMSKATPLGAIAKFAAAGKPLGKKDLGMMMMTYGRIYVAKVALGSNPTKTVRAFIEAESYPGPSIILAYSHCIAHGINMTEGLKFQKMAVESGAWPLFRFDPTLAEQGKNPLQLDSKAPTENIEEFMYKQNRFRSLRQANPERANMLLEAIRQDVITRWKFYEQMANLDI